MENSTPFAAGFSDAISGKLLNHTAPTQEYFNRYTQGYQAGYSRLNEYLKECSKQQTQVD
jgi:hypothetical protein